MSTLYLAPDQVSTTLKGGSLTQCIGKGNMLGGSVICQQSYSTW